MAKEKVILKDELFNRETVTILSNVIKTVYISFDEKQFIKDVLSEFKNLELMDRIHWISMMLKKHLPVSYVDSLTILKNSLINIKSESMFAFAAFPDFVKDNGCKIENLELSLDMLGEFTKMFSAEFAIREFINMFPNETYARMLEWSKSDNVHIRRLSSEGLRPKLPWAKGINFDTVKGALPLNNLYYDKERYVTRSVANHLNDLSKIDPALVLKTLSNWKKSNKQNEKEMNYIINHSLRTLVKKGHKDTLEFLGYNTIPKVLVNNLEIKNTKISIGESIYFSFDIKALEDELLVVDYIVEYPKAKNRKSKKVFKIKKVFLSKNESITISKKQAFKVMTTKKLYTGDYSLSIMVNGKEYGNAKFFIEV